MKPFRLSALLFVTFLAGCGSGSLSNDQKQDASNVVVALSGGLASNSSSTNYLTGSAQEDAAVKGAAAQLREQFDGAVWLAFFRAEGGTGASSPERSDATLTCSASSFSSTTASCAVTCPSSSSVKIACSSSASSTTTCGTTSYTLSNPAFSVTVDVANVSGSGSSATGSLTVGVSVSANVTGNKLTGKQLACSLSATLDAAKLKAGTAQSFTPSCSSYSCTYDGVTIPCEDIKTYMAQKNLSCG